MMSSRDISLNNKLIKQKYNHKSMKSMKAIEVVLGDESEFQIASLHDQVVKSHGAFGLVAIGEEDYCLACFSLSEVAELNTSSHEVEAFEDLLDVPVVQSEGEASDFDGGFFQ